MKLERFHKLIVVLSGVPQGSVLGPILFVVYINDLPQEITYFLYMYADDTKLFRESSTDVDRAELQKDLEMLNEWTEKWQLRFNVEKCKIMYLGGPRNMRKEYRLENMSMTALQETVVEKEFGVWMTNDLKPHHHVDHAVSRGCIAILII